MRRARWQAHLEQAARAWRSWAEHRVRKPALAQANSALDQAMLAGSEDSAPGEPTGPGVDVETLCAELGRNFDRPLSGYVRTNQQGYIDLAAEMQASLNQTPQT